MRAALGLGSASELRLPLARGRWMRPDPEFWVVLDLGWEAPLGLKDPLGRDSVLTGLDRELVEGLEPEAVLTGAPT